MNVAIKADPVPLVLDNSETLRVGGTRVTLDTIVEAFGEGLSAEEIASQFPVLSLADIYATVAYYLRHRRALDEYLKDRRNDAEDLRRSLEDAFPSDTLRQRLLARRETHG